MNVDVVIPYCDAPERLASILAALDVQVDHATGRTLDGISVVVADDASRVAPVVAIGKHPTSVVRQEEPGYHAASARNLGAAASDSPVIVFLDGDTVPSPDYVTRLVQPVVDGDVGLTTGRRRHADFSGLGVDDVVAFAAEPDADRLLSEPAWLADGLSRTDSLRSATPDVFQYVISAVLAVDRSMFESVCGFDEAFDTYGGEDWEFAYRCWNGGWAFAHVADAVAFHDGPDVEGRVPDLHAKTIENLRIANLVPASPTRLPNVDYTVPDIDISLVLSDDDLRMNAIGLWSVLSSHRTDLRVRLHGRHEDIAAITRHVGDRRVVRGSVPPHGSSRCHVLMSQPVDLQPNALGELCDDLCSGVLDHRRIRVGDANDRCMVGESDDGRTTGSNGRPAERVRHSSTTRSRRRPGQRPRSVESTAISRSENVTEACDVVRVRRSDGRSSRLGIGGSRSVERLVRLMCGTSPISLARPG